MAVLLAKVRHYQHGRYASRGVIFNASRGVKYNAPTLFREEIKAYF